MKKLILTGLLPLLLIALLTASAGAAGTKDDPLISLSFLNGEYKTELKTAAADETGKLLDAVYDAAIAKLTGSGRLPGYHLTRRFIEIYLTEGKTVELAPGASLVPTSGTVSLTVLSGTVINVSTGAESAPGTQLTANNRYFCAEDSSALFTASSRALVQVDGYYKTDGLAGYTPVFKDVKLTDWFSDAVDYVYNNGLFTGTASDVFSPNASMTRGMFVTVLHRLAGKPESAAAVQFSDVADPSQYYYAAVVWANANGVVTGYEDGTFLPNSSITREQMAVIMYRYAQLAGKNTQADGAAFEGFPDKDAVSAYAADAVRWATSLGIINGADGKLLPGSTATRAQVAQIILNFNVKAA